MQHALLDSWVAMLVQGLECSLALHVQHDLH